MTIQRNHLAGALVGLAVGDAVGTTLEFTPHNPNGYGLTDMIGKGPFKLPKGAWTDDTSMALCLADSLLETQDFDTKDQAERYARWANTGYRSSTGRCFDIGGTVRASLWWHSAHCNDRGYDALVPTDTVNGDGNGSLMRVAPIALRYAKRGIETAGNYAYIQSRVTHGGLEAAYACDLWTQMIIAAATEGATKQSVIQAAIDAITPNIELCSVSESQIVAILIDATYACKTAEDIHGSGYVVEAFEAALWAWWNTDTFADAVLAAANLGQDADTTAAIVGQLAGAFYGLDGIPQAWRDRIVQSAEIHRIAFALIDAGTPKNA